MEQQRTDLNPLLRAKVRAPTDVAVGKGNEAAVANATGTDEPRSVARRKRIPMSVARRKMEVQALPGWHLHWFSDTNVPLAIDAGYEFVDKSEISLNQLGVGANHNMTGNTDMGSRVSIIGSLNKGSDDNRGPERAYLMKLKEEYRQEDLQEMARIAARPLEAIFSGEMIAGPEGKLNDSGELVYVKTALLNRGPRKAKLTR
jgi:hypothetical protein